MKTLRLVALLFVSTAAAAAPLGAPVAPVQAEMRLGMRESGDRTEISADQLVTKKVFILVIGDPSREDQRMMGRTLAGLGAFAMDSAQYFHNEDTSWRVFNFRMPSPGESEAFIDFLSDPRAEQFLKDPYVRENVGKPGDFVYKNMNVPQSDLPAPLSRASTKTLEAIAGIFRYNADGTMKIFLKQPLDEEENAKQVYWQLKKEIEAR